MFNDQEVDNYSEKNMYTKRDAKSFRHISNTFDIRNMKLTEDVYSNYLRRMYSTLERGNLSVETMGGSRVTGGGRTMKKNPVMVDYGINLMKTVLHKPDAKSNVFGYDFSTSKMHRHFFGKFKKLGITEYKLDKYVRTISAYITGRYLGRPDTAFLNRTVALNKMINYGWGDYQKARIAVQNHKKVINGFVAETGVTDWSDYFTRELLGDLTQTDVITRDESLKVVKAMLDFHIALKKGVKEPVAKKALIKTVSKLAKNTPAIKSMLENIPEERKLRDKRRADTENKLLHITNRWASWAITKEYSAYPMSQQDLTKLQWLSRFTGKGMEALNNAIMKLPGAKSFLTMSEVETQMRSESVVLAMIKLQETGQLKIDQLENIDFIAALELEESGKLTTDQLKLLKEDKELVKKVARDFVAQTDMQMTTSDVGMYNRAFGGLHTRFTIYIQQKYGHDVALFKKYYRSLSSDDKKSPIGIRTKEMIKAMGTFRKKEMDKLWKKNPDMVKLRNFILSSGLITLFFDLILFVPGATKIMRNLPFLRNRTLVKFASGLTSDVVSLTTSLPLYLLFALMADEDEEEVQNEVYYKLRRLPFLGFGSGVILDQVFALFSMAMDINENEKARRMARAISPMLPLPPPSSYVLDPIARETIQGAIQD
jgi:hypothetical protein